MNIMHQEIIKLLKEIDEICKKYDITYYAAGGTTIGAIRHRGFIPWDDDADIYMTRNEFYRFREAFQKEKPEGRVLECLTDNPEYPATIPRYTDDTTSMVGKFHVLNTCSAGMVIDVFILDPVPDDVEKQREYIAKLFIFSDYVMPYYVYSNRADTRYLGMYDEYKKLEEKIGREGVIKKLTEELFSYDDEECNYYVLRWGTLPHVFPKEYFGEPVYYPFEDMQVPLPAMWYEYLVQLYGPKWMYIPDHDDQEAHSHIIDVEHKYTNYLIDADRFIDKKETLDMYLTRKGIVYHRQRYLREFQDYIMEQNVKAGVASQEKYIEHNGFDVPALFEAGEYKKILEIYQKYLDFQFGKSAIGAMRHSYMYRFRNRVYVPLPDDQLYIVLYSLWFTGQFARARTIMDIRKAHGELTPDLVWMDERITLIYQILQQFYTNDYEKAQLLIEKLDETERKKIRDVEKMQLQMDCERLSAEECKARIPQISDVLSKGKYDAEYTKILGDYYYKAGDEDKAKELYLKAEPDLTNGMMLLDISDKYHIAPNYNTPARKTPLTIMQRAQFKMLCEVDDICRENGIQYVLIHKTLWYVWYHRNLPPSSESAIAMTPDQALRFVKAFEKKDRPGRRIEYTLNNPEHSAFGIDYINDNTLTFSWGEPEDDGRPLCLRIHILKIKDRRGLHWKYVRLLDTAQILRERRDKGKLDKWDKDRFTSIFTSPIIAIKGKDKLAQEVFKEYCSMEQDPADPAYYTTLSNGRRNIGKKIPARHIEKTGEIRLYGRSFMIPSDMEEYIPIVYGKYPLRKYKLEDGYPKIMRYIDEEIGIEDFSKAVDRNVTDTEMFARFCEGAAMNETVSEYGKIVEYNMAILFRARDRFQLFLKYMPMKEEILKAYHKQDVEKLDAMFRDYYDAVVENMHTFKLGICFDQEILEAFLWYLEQIEEQGLAEKLKENIPEEHLAPMQILD